MSTNNFREILQKRELYLLETEVDGKFLLYAPLADSILPVSEEDVCKLADAVVSPENADTDTLETVAALCDVEPVSMREGHVRGVEDFINLSILPNNVCNFSCSYCYSAKGRSKQRMKLGQAIQMIDYFMDKKRNDSDFLTVTIFGGGEPLLSWDDIVKPAVQYIYSRNICQRKVVVTLITNGSIIPDGFIEICRTYDIDLVCSYEILRDVQDSQRRHYNLVSKNIATLIENGVVPAINSVITELNVERQQEMISVLAHNFPQIKHVAFEPVIGDDIADKDSFYLKFTTSFLKAKRFAEQQGIVLTCSALRNVDVTVDRYCAGELALCADGSISICPCVSSPEEKNYSSYIYGKVDEHGVSIDKDKLSSLLKANVHSQPWCDGCFAKWNCGGGCINNTKNNGGGQIPQYCRFVRRFLKYILARRLDDIWQEENDESIKKIIGDYERFIEE